MSTHLRHTPWLLTLVFLLTSSCLADVTFEEVFHLDIKAAERALGAERFKRLQNALDDFNAILDFKRPVHAQRDKNAAVPGDGGTHYYQGQGYRVTLMHSSFSLGRPHNIFGSSPADRAAQDAAVNGFMYGPVLSLGDEFGFGFKDISRVSFFPGTTLKERLKW